MAADEMPSPPAAESTAARILGRLVPFLLALAIVGAFCLRQLAESDLGWHLALGKVVADKGIPYTNALCWTALNHPWFANSWLFDWVAYLLAARFGMGAVQLLMFALFVVTLAGVQATALRLDSRFGGWTTPLIALLLIPRITERPFVATWIALIWVLFLSIPEAIPSPDRFSRTFRRRVWSLPIIAVCANLHQGALFAAIILGFFCAESFLRSGRRLRELALAAAGVLALFANPGGMFGLLDSLGHVNLQSQVGLGEYRPPGLSTGYLFFTLVALTVPIAFLSWRRSLALLGVMVMFAGLGAWALRFTYDFELLAVPVLALGLGMLARRFGTPIAAVTLAGLLAALVAVRWEWRVSLLLIGPEWNRWSVPVDGAEFIQQEHLDGRMYNGYWEGGYLEWALNDRTWFQDGRPHAFPLGFFQRAYAVNDSPEEFRRWMRELDVEWAITGMGAYLDGKHQLHDPAWALVFWDDISEVFVRRDVARFKGVVDRLEFKHFNDVVDVPRALSVAPKADLPGWQSELERVEKAMPDSRLPVLARCALEARAGTAKTACDLALTLKDDSAWKAQVEFARAIAPAP